MIRSLMTRFLKPRTVRPQLALRHHNLRRRAAQISVMALVLASMAAPAMAAADLDTSISNGLTWAVKVVRYGCLAVMAALSLKHAVDWGQNKENPSMAHQARNHFFIYGAIFVAIVMAKMVLVGALQATGNDAILLPAWLVNGLTT